MVGVGLAVAAGMAPPQSVAEDTTGASASSPVALVARTADGAVDVDLDELRAADVGSTLTLELPDGPETATVTYRDEQSGFTGWSGTVGDGWFDAVLADDDTLSIDVHLADAAYVIDDGAAGYRMLDRSDVAPPAAHDDAVIPPAQLPEVPARAAAQRPGAPAQGRKGPRKVRVLFVYSKEARKAAGGRKKVRSMAQKVIQQTNYSFKISKVGVRVVLAGVKQTSREKRKNTTANLKSLWKRDGRYDAVPRWRKKNKADLVHLFVKTAERGTCGRGYLRPRAVYAYSTARVQCATRYRSSAHELGHNFGADHDERAGYKPTSRRPARGKVNIAKEWYTVMAYHTACTNQGVYCRQIPYFSTPKAKYQGVRVGSKKKADNASVIRKRARKVAKFG